jgi:hypothetical protein
MTTKFIHDCWGRVEVVPLESSETSPNAGSTTLAVDDHQYVWRPSRQLDALPADYRVELNAMSRHGSGRRFWPSDRDSFVQNASLGGLAILDAIKQLDGEHRSTYHLMRLIHLHGPRVQEALLRNLRRPVDLLALGVESEVGSPNILPEDLGLDAFGKGDRWSVSRLIKEGEREADARNLEDCTPGDFIRLGVLAAARRNPIEISQLDVDEAVGWLRLALFDLGPADVRIDENTKLVVITRLREAVHKHLEDSEEAFTKWFVTERDNIVHQIAKRKSGPGPIERVVVREVLLELVFDSLRYAGQCLHIQMFDFLRAIEPSLDASEKAIFELLYCEQPWLGGVPLAVLHRYFEPAREAILDLWNDPENPEKAGVLLRVLQYQAVMVTKRREADRAAKRRESASVEVRLKPSDVGPVAQESLEETLLRLADLGKRLITVAKVRCQCAVATKLTAYFDLEGSSVDSVDVGFTCGQCGCSQRLTFSCDQVSQVLLAKDEPPE